MKNEYTKERERSGILDNKAIAILTVLLAILTLYIPMIPFDKITWVIGNGTCEQRMVLLLAAILLVSALVISIVEMYYLIRALRLRTFLRVNIDALIVDEALKANRDVVERGLVQHYYQLIIHNSNVNDAKGENVQKAFLGLIAVFVLMMTATIVLSFISGGVR